MREHITFGFVGIGLIGGSVAKALRRVYPSCKIKLLMSVIIFFFALLLKKMLNI